MRTYSSVRYGVAHLEYLALYRLWETLKVFYIYPERKIDLVQLVNYAKRVAAAICRAECVDCAQHTASRLVWYLLGHPPH